MTDKEQLEQDLVNALGKHLSGEAFQDLKLQICLILQPYHIEAHGTEVAVYQGDKNAIAIQSFLRAKMAKGLSSRTIQYYRFALTFFFDHIDGKGFDEITTGDIRGYLAVRTQRDGVSKVTANNERRALSSFYSWLQREEAIHRNPMLKVDPIKETKRKKKAYDLLDLERIRMNCRTSRERALIEMLASTWCRISEVVNVRIDDIQDDSITVRGKGDKYRDVFLNARAKLAIESYLSERMDLNPYLFPKMAGTESFQNTRRAASMRPDWYRQAELVDASEHMNVSSAENIIRGIGKRSGVTGCHPHRFRRTGATLALRAGMPVTDVQKILGHANIETTQIYLDISDDEVKHSHQKYVT